MMLFKQLKYCLLGLLLNTALIATTQTQQFNINWYDIQTETVNGVTINTVGFQNAENHQRYGLLPVFVHHIKNALPGLTHQFTVSDIVHEKFDANSDFEDKELIPEKFDHFTETITIRNNQYSVFRMLPIRINPENGKLEKVVSFTLETVILPEVAKNRQNPDDLFALNSVLATGTWHKIAIQEEGIYKVSYELLDELGVELNGIASENIMLYGNGWGMLPEKNANYRPDDLIENAIMVFDGNDGTFDPGDYFIFFGQSPDKWEFNSVKGVYEHNHHYYSDFNYYFITIGTQPGKRIEPMPQPPLQSEIIVSTYNDFAVHELNERNLIHSGSEWYGEVFSDELEQTIVFDLPARDVSEPVHITAEFVAKSTKTSNFFVNVNGVDLIQRPITAVPSNSLTKYANAGSRSVWFTSDVIPSLNLIITYDKPEANATGWLSFIELNFMNHLRFADKTFRFRNHSTVGPQKITEFSVANTNMDFKVWNINDPYHPKTIQLTYLNEQANFILPTDSLLEFVGFSQATYKIPEPIGEVPNQNLHAITEAEFIIASHADFLDQAERLKALHEEVDGMNVVVVDIEQVYNEFSSGSPDPSAIRDFARMVYLRSGSTPALKYLLLFGDGSYDPKNRIPDNKNFIIAYQSKQSLWPTATYVTDDFYGMMDPDEGVDAGGNVDLGIGRLPVNTPEEAKMMVDKIESYMKFRPENQGTWRNTLCFIADDEDFNLHFYQADTILVSLIERNNKNVNINKIYLDAYPQQTTASGQFYPDVNSAINTQVNEGAVIVNYTGHGGEFGLAAEKILVNNDIVSWTNYDALTVFITATCEFAPFDNPSLTSSGEMVLLNPRGGGVALFSTTRRAFASSNLLLNRRFYDTLFRAYPNAHPRLGDLMMFSKNPANSNIRNFVLLGNPALKLALPYHNIVTDSINGMSAHLFSDTLGANSIVTISGFIEHYQSDGEVLEDFNGLIYPVLYDKPDTISTLGNDSKSFPVDFQVQNSILCKGTASVNNGRFKFTFILPKDMSFTYGNGKISYYATDNQRDASGFYSDFIIGGLGDGNMADDKGPEIEMYLNDASFESFTEVNNNPVLHARLSDNSGINWLGNSIGRDITLTMNGNHRQSMILNKYFEPEVDDFRSGIITLPLNNLPNGEYVLELRAWDMMNNSAEKSIFFTVSDSINIDVMEILNYPNPFYDHTYFSFRHNQFQGELTARIEIFNFYGQLVETIGPQTIPASGYTIEPLFWDGTSAGGSKLESGIYYYKISITSQNGQTAERVQKMIIAR